MSYDVPGSHFRTEPYPVACCPAGYVRWRGRAGIQASVPERRYSIPTDASVAPASTNGRSIPMLKHVAERFRAPSVTPVND